MGRKKNVTPDFQTFWDMYGVKRERIDAELAWQRLSDKDRSAACAGIAGYREECERRGERMAYGQSYLHRRRWENAGTSRRGNTQPAAFEEMEKW